MRYITARFRRDGGALHPWGAALTDEQSVRRGPVYAMDLLEDGTATVVCRLYGDVEQGYALTQAHEYVRDVTVADTDPGYLYVHLDTTEATREMFEFPRRTDLALVLPVHIEDDGAVVGTFVGSEAAFSRSLSVIPDVVEVELVETGAYEPETDEVLGSLTGRQRTILDAAVSLGYYECPREATQAEVAEAVGLATGTVGEHLRKIEARTFSRLLG